MNRKERRRAAKMERKDFAPEEARKFGSMCAWAGCEECFTGTLPDGWRWLVLHWQPEPDAEALASNLATGRHIDRDACLCPEHVRQLDGQLRDVGRWADEPVAGTS